MTYTAFVKRWTPRWILNLRHLWYAWYGAVRYRHPSEELLVIGITGTSGKSSTVDFLRTVFETAGYRVGSLSTVDFSIAGKRQLNNKKMTMLGKTAIQKYLRTMVEEHCTVAIIETTSEGFVQYRHRSINYDAIILTNLYPEHIESHGSFDKYKDAKKGIFAYVARCPKKKRTIRGMSEIVQSKIAIVNGTGEYAKEFLTFPFDKKYIFAAEALPQEIMRLGDVVQATQVAHDDKGIHFLVLGHTFHSPLHGDHHVMNLLAGITLAQACGVAWGQVQAAVAQFRGTPGRIEFIREAETKNFQVIVDYAFEPVAMEALYRVIKKLPHNKIIHVLGSTGGGRDVARRFTVGSFVGTHADLCIVTNEDPYDDDPQLIMNDVANALESGGKKRGETIHLIPDRREAIRRAIQLAKPGDIVLVTGKGSEQGMMVQGKLIPWDDRTVVREAIQTL